MLQKILLYLLSFSEDSLVLSIVEGVVLGFLLIIFLITLYHILSLRGRLNSTYLGKERSKFQSTLTYKMTIVLTTAEILTMKTEDVTFMVNNHLAAISSLSDVSITKTKRSLPRSFSGVDGHFCVQTIAEERFVK